MFAAAHDQENLTHAHQLAAAAKPLNQGTRNFGSKTPGNKVPKTPLRVTLNDDSVPLKAARGSVFKENGSDENAKNGKLGKEGQNAFVTPAGPRTRAPLGIKTTNAKTKAFQTPAPPLSIGSSKEKTVPKSLSPRMRRPKVKVHHEEPAKLEDVNDEPEIEYMPPRPSPLPDHPDDDFPADKKYPMFKPENITRGWYSTFANPEEDDRVTKFEKREAAEQAARDKAVDEMLQATIDADKFLVSDIPEFNGVDFSGSKSTDREEASTSKIIKAQVKRTNAGPSLYASKSAASALSHPQKSTISSLTRPTASTAQKAIAPCAKPLPRKTQAPTQRALSGNVAASRTTLGYANGRAASSNLRRPLGEVIIKKPSMAVDAKPKSQSATSFRAAGRVVAAQPETQRSAPSSGLEALIERNAKGLDFLDLLDGDEGEDLASGETPMLDEVLFGEINEEFRFELPEDF